MSPSVHRATRRRTAVAAGAALLAQTAMLLSGTAMSPAYAAVPAPVAPPAAPAAPAAAPAAADCGLQLLTRNDTGAASDLQVALPERLAGVEVLPGAFSLRQADRDVPVTVRRPPPAEQAVGVVLASSSETSAAQYDAAQRAARDLLVSLPPGTRTAVSSTSSTSPLAPLTLDRVRATRSVELARAQAGATAVATVDRLARELPAGAAIVLFSDGAEEGTSLQMQALASQLRERGTVVTRVGYAGPSSSEVATVWSTSPSQRACAAATAAAPLPRQVERVKMLLQGRYQVSASLDDTAPATLSVRAADVASSIQLPAVEALTALADPYRRTGLPGSVTLLLFAIAAELAVLGLLLVLRPRRRRRWRRLTAPARQRSDEQTAPVEWSEGGLDRIGLGARSST